MFAGLLLLIGEVTLGRARAALSTIAKDTAPSIIAAQAINVGLASLDGSVADMLLATTAEQRERAKAVFEESRVAITRRLIEAAQNITFGEAEKRPITTMFLELGRYLELVSDARNGRGQSGTSDAAAASYRRASELLHKTILEAGHALDRANSGRMTFAYDAQQSAITGTELFALLVGGLLMTTLVLAQIFLFRRMRRVFNLGLLAASFATLFFVIYLVSAFGNARDDLRVAKKDAFDSVHLMAEAQALVHDAYGDSRRFLLEGVNTTQLQADFDRKVTRLSTQPVPSEAILRELARKRVSFNGLLAKELKNVTFPGEDRLARQAIDDFAQFVGRDGRMRELARSNRGFAIELATGNRSDGLREAFNAFDDRLRQIIALNRREFDAVIDVGQQSLRRAAYMDPGFALLIALASFLGMRPRIREYAA